MVQRFTAIRELSHSAIKFSSFGSLYRCPCLTCSVKIAQVGISEVVYSYDYNVDTMVSDHSLDVYKTNHSGCIYIQGSGSQVETVHTGKLKTFHD
jgi:hypothetical protein